jgi:hypothetical protein
MILNYLVKLGLMTESIIIQMYFKSNPIFEFSHGMTKKISKRSFLSFFSLLMPLAPRLNHGPSVFPPITFTGAF